MRQKWESFPLVEWNGTDMLFLYGDERYFRDEEEIEEFCEEQELTLDDLMLVVCRPSNFSHISLDNITNDFELVYEDWSPSDELVNKINEFNTWLDSQSTNTWFPSNQKVILKK